MLAVNRNKYVYCLHDCDKLGASVSWSVIALVCSEFLCLITHILTRSKGFEFQQVSIH